MQARLRFWLEAALASIAGALAVTTVAWPSWIEGLTGLEPDQGSGTVEVFVTLLFAVIAIGLAMVARLEWRRLRTLHSL